MGVFASVIRRVKHLSDIVSHFCSDVAAVKPGLPPFGFAVCSLGSDGVFGSKYNGHLVGSDDVTTCQ